MLRYSLLLLALAVLGCAARSPVPGAAPPSALLGTFADDYGNRYTITAAEWVQHPNTRYHIVLWDPVRRFLVAMNDPANPADGGLWTRIDWIPLDGMLPWQWAYCYSAYQAESAEAAESASVARPDTPRTGCNGFPFSRMQPDSSSPFP